MLVNTLPFKSGNQLSKRSIIYWRTAQLSVWLVGLFILFSLLWYPSLGLSLFWNLLIPVAPFLFLIATGVWRNVCPLATTQLFPRHMGWSKSKKLTHLQLGKLNLLSVILLYAIVPLRHALFNNNGTATFLLILFFALIGVILGFNYEWKSAWCSGLCPVHPVEKLYGGNVLMSFPNAHCGECMNCVVPCPDATPHINPSSSQKTIYHQLSGLLIVGGLPGFIWGWFQVPDVQGFSAISVFLKVYTWPMIGFCISLVLYAILNTSFKKIHQRKLIGIFAAAGISIYYWYRIPALFGYGKFAEDGMLLDLTNLLPEWSMMLITVSASLFFFYWLVLRKKENTHWVVRPAFGNRYS